MSALIGIGAGLIGGYFASRRAEKAQSEAAAQMKALMERYGAPFEEATKFALPLYKQLIMDELMPLLGQESEVLAAGHQRELGRLGRLGEREQAESRRYWGARGATGRGRGERFRTRRATERAIGGEKIRRAGEKVARQRGLRGELFGAVGGLSALGASGIGGIMGGQLQATQAAGQAKAGFWGDVGAGIGFAGGQWSQQQFQDRLMEMMAEWEATGETPWKKKKKAAALPPPPALQPLALSI